MSKLITKKFLLPFLLFIFIVFPVVVLPQGTEQGLTYECYSGGVYGNCSFDDLVMATKNFINKITIIVLELTVFIIAYAGFQYMTSGGNVSQRASATRMLFSVVKGIAIIVAAWLIVTLIANALVTTCAPGATDTTKCIPKLLN